MRDWLLLLAAVGTLTLSVIVAFAGKRSPLARAIAALCFVLFGWNFSTLVHHVLVRQSGGGEGFALLDAAFSALSPPLVLEVVLSFLGALRRFRALRAVSWAVFGALAAAALGGFVSPDLARWVDGEAWAVLLLVASVPTFVVEATLVGRYLKRASDDREASRARLVLAALAIGASFSTTDLVNGAGVDVPCLGSLGTLVAAALLTTLVTRLSLFDRSLSLRTTVYVLVMIAAFVACCLVVLSAFAGSLAVQLFAVSVLGLLVAAAARELAASLAEARARTQRLAVLGRFSQQMSHDMKGPLTALLGAVQVLEGARAAEERDELLGLVSAQAKRLAAVIERYDRMARVEPRRTLVRVDEVVRAAARAHGVPDDGAHLVLATPPIECDADQALLESAVENVVRNAVEATSDPALVRVETAVDPVLREAVIRVVDRGPGMDARVLERAVEDFFTTKAGGSGLGLAFARRVLEAHGGGLALDSRPGEGTSVELRLPYEGR